MTVPAALTAADLDRIEPDHGVLRRYRVTLTNAETRESETHEVDATNCAKAKGIALCRMRMRLCGARLLNDVVRLGGPSPDVR